MAGKAFSGGDKLTRYLADLGKKLGRDDTLRVGFLEGATYPDGTPVALVAAVNEFGGQDTPARPFFRGMVEDKSPDWGQALAQILQQNGGDLDAALKLMGEGISGQLREAITDFAGTPLNPKTVLRKGSDKQLVDTGHMLNSIDWDIKSDGQSGSNSSSREGAAEEVEGDVEEAVEGIAGLL